MSASESRTKSRVQLGPKSNDPHTADWGFYTSTDMILSNSNHLRFLLPFLLSTFPAHTSRSLPSPTYLMEATSPVAARAHPAVMTQLSTSAYAPLIWEQSWGYLLGLHSYYNELALETSARQKSNILTLYLSNL